MQKYKEVKEFRYVKKEIFAMLLGVFGILFFLIILTYLFFAPRFFNKVTQSDYIFLILFIITCLVGILDFLYMWFRRKSFVIITDNEGITVPRFDKAKKINWKMIASYIYQCGHPFWFISLKLIDGRCINLHGELTNFDDLINLIKDNVKCSANEFQYTMRRRMGFVLLGVFLFFNIIIIIMSLRDAFVGHMPWNDALGIIGLLSLLSTGAIFQQFNSAKLFVNKNGLNMKHLLAKSIFIPWSAITDNSQVQITRVMLTFTEKGWKLTIRSNKKTIFFYEDLDNVDELVNIIETKTGISLGV